MRKIFRLVSLSLLVVILLSACSLPFFGSKQPTPTPTLAATPTASATQQANGELGTCVTGTWRVKDLTGFTTRIHAAWLNLPDAWEDYQEMSVARSSGEMLLTFDGNGNVTGTGTDYQVDAVVYLVGIRLNLGAVINGSGHATYSVDETMKNISFVQPEADDMTVSIKINDATMIKDASMNDMAILKKMQRSGIGLRVACAEDALRIEIETTEAEGMPQAISLERVK